MKIIIVDDEISFTQGLQLVLEHKGYSVDVADNGSSAIKLFKSHTYELVVTDIIMPEMDGIELILKLTKEYPDVKIIAISGGGRISASGHLDAAQKIGADEVLAKPFTTKQLLDTIQKVCA